MCVAELLFYPIDPSDLPCDHLYGVKTGLIVNQYSSKLSWCAVHFTVTIFYIFFEYRTYTCNCCIGSFTPINDHRTCSSSATGFYSQYWNISCKALTIERGTVMISLIQLLTHLLRTLHFSAGASFGNSE